MLSQSRSLEFLIVQSISYSKLYFTFWAWLDYEYCYKYCIQRQMVVTHIFYFMLCQSSLLSTVIHRMDKRKSFVFARQYRNRFSRRINALVPRN